MSRVIVRSEPKDVKVTASGPARGEPGPAGPPGPQGEAAVWTEMTQAEYNALTPPDPDTLYIIIG